MIERRASNKFPSSSLRENLDRGQYRTDSRTALGDAWNRFRYLIPSSFGIVSFSLEIQLALGTATLRT